MASHDAWDKPFVANMKDFLHEGENNVAIVVRNSSGAGGLLKGIRLFSELKILKPLKWEVALDLGGVTQGYCGGKTELPLRTFFPITSDIMPIQPHISCT